MLLILSEISFGIFLCPAASQWKLNAVLLPASSQVQISECKSEIIAPNTKFNLQKTGSIFGASAHRVTVNCIHYLRWLVGVF